MKRIHLPICLVLLSLLMTSCGKEEPFAPAGNANPVELRVVADNFVSTQGATRASEAGYVTTFTANDQIGIFAVKTSNGFVLDKNIPYKYNGTAWVPADPANTVHHYNFLEDVTYFAYYPYSATMDDATSEADIQAKFTPKPDQSTYADYTASDLMTGAGTLSTTGDTRTLTLELKHRMALLVLCPDLYARCVAPTGAGYEYYQEAQAKCVATNVTIKEAAAYAVGDDTYRLIVKPGTTDVPLAYTLGTIATSYTFTNQTLTAGTYREFKMGHPAALTVEREMQLGDYYYTDGKLAPGADGKDPIKEECIGVVFHVGPGEGDAIDNYADIGISGDIHGYVVALQDAGDGNWGVRGAIAPIPQIERDGTVGSEERKSYRGYKNTKTILNMNNAEYQVFINANKYNTTVPAPNKSSGWYLPTIQQMQDIFALYKNAAGNVVYDSMLKAGGTLFSGGTYWTASQAYGICAYKIQMTNGKFDSLSGKNHSMHSRAILTF